MPISSFVEAIRPPAVLPRSRGAAMDALVKHAHTNDAYAFEAVCQAVGAAVSKAKAP